MKQSRVERVLANMEKAGLPQILIAEPASIYYLLGHSVDPGERLYALLLSPKGAHLFYNALYPTPSLEGVTAHPYLDAEDPLEALAQTVAAGRLGVDKAWPARFVLGLMEKRPDIKPALGSAPVDDARRIKDAEELAAMREASRLNDRVMEAALRLPQAGMEERALARAIEELYAQNQADAGAYAGVGFGKNCAEPHHGPDGSRLAAGEAVLLDIFAPVGRYWCDMTRTVFFRHASDEQKRVYEVVRAANAAGIGAVRPGVPLCEIDRAARRVIEEAGFGPYFTHRLGHGIGLACHEPPDCSASCGQAAEPGMCFSIEPGIYLPGRFGVRVEDLVAVTPDGVEVLNQFPKELLVLP